MDPASGSPTGFAAPELQQRFLHDIVQEAAAQIEGLAEDETAQWCARAVIVLEANLASGRFTLAEPAHPDAVTPTAYARQVLEGLLAEWELVEHLRTGEATAWTAIRERFERLAYHWLGPSGREQWAVEEAREVAAKTCADLWSWLQNRIFPFDVPFDRWSARSLTNRLLETTRKRRTRSRYESDSLDRPMFDQEMTLGETLTRYDIEDWLEVEANREVLYQVIERLSERDADILRRWYLDGWSGDEIAAALGVTVKNVYVIRFRALKRLRELLRYDERFGLAEVLKRIEAKQRRLPPGAQTDLEEFNGS